MPQPDLEAITAEHFPRIHRAALVLSGNPWDADDLAQETFLTFAASLCLLAIMVAPCPFIELNAEMAPQCPVITEKKAPPPDAKEWEGKPDKKKLLER